MEVKIFDTKIKEVLIFQPKEFLDNRGYLIESYNKYKYDNFLPSVDFMQDNESKSTYGVLRGLHYQDEPYPQAKLVRVVKGEIQDVAIDIRKDSSTYLEYVSVNLSGENKKQLYVPRGFAHGFLVLSQEAIVCYKIDNKFNLDYYKGLRYDDPKINIKWQLNDNQIQLSDKDKKLNFI